MMRLMMVSALATTLVACGGGETPDKQEGTATENPPPAAATTSDALKMYILDCGTIEISDLGVFSTSGDYDGISDTFTDTCYLLRHPKGDMIWDLGLPTALAGEPPLEDDIYTVSLDKTITDQLIEIGLGPEEIEYVAISHQHFDHVGQIDQIQDATWLVHEDEYNSMFPPAEEPTTAEGEEGGETSEGNDAGAGSPFSGFESLERELFTGEKDVFGDGSVVIFETPGHTPGHTSLQVELPKTGTVILTGDLYHRTESRSGEHVPQFNVSEPMTRESMKIFEERAQRTGAKVIIQHETDDIDLLPKAPTPME